MAVKTLDSNQARNHWREMLDTVLKNDADVVITRYDQPVAALLAYEDYLAVHDELIKRRASRKARAKVERETLATMLASERMLAREWNSPAEDEAWANL
jgi:PHD/YefM family antitoxin component YafN of YafNO toxin-antitoxin module